MCCQRKDKVETDTLIKFCTVLPQLGSVHEHATHLHSKYWCAWLVCVEVSNFQAVQIVWVLKTNQMWKASLLLVGTGYLLLHLTAADYYRRFASVSLVLLNLYSCSGSRPLLGRQLKSDVHRTGLPGANTVFSVNVGRSRSQKEGMREFNFHSTFIERGCHASTTAIKKWYMEVN